MADVEKLLQVERKDLLISTPVMARKNMAVSGLEPILGNVHGEIRLIRTAGI
jgi:hypothetical protein